MPEHRRLFSFLSRRENTLPLNECGVCRGGCESPTQGTGDSCRESIFRFAWEFNPRHDPA